MSERIDSSALETTRFVSNYPPYDHWSPETVPRALDALDASSTSDVPLGIYVHVPFCRKRCHFCYFRVVTGASSEEIGRYVAALGQELEMVAQAAAVRGRNPSFVYFGGGTPSYLSSAQLAGLFDALWSHFDASAIEEVTFECEPGTLNRAKVRVLEELGVTRLSLGVEHFDDRVLEWNGRAHRQPEIHRSMEWISAMGFPQWNVDLIAGLVGDSADLWSSTLDRTVAAQPDSLTVYSLEIPPNTTLHRDIRTTGELDAPLPDADFRRHAVRAAFDRFMACGYQVSSAYTLAKPSSDFVYRDRLWEGADMVGVGVSAFSHVGGVHYQNHSHWGPYLDAVESKSLPVARAYAMNPDERLVREVILQLKRGYLDRDRFLARHGVDVLDRFAAPLDRLVGRDLANISDSGVQLSLDGLLQVDGLLSLFFPEKHRA